MSEYRYTSRHTRLWIGYIVLVILVTPILFVVPPRVAVILLLTQLFSVIGIVVLSRMQT
jgi:hypothetical protein